MLKRFLILPNESIEHFHLGNFSTSSRLQNRLYGLLLQVPCEPIEGGDLLSQLRWNCSHSTFITSVEPHPNQTFLYTPTVFQNWLVGLYRGWHFLPSYIRIIINHYKDHIWTNQYNPSLKKYLVRIGVNEPRLTPPEKQPFRCSKKHLLTGVFGEFWKTRALFLLHVFFVRTRRLKKKHGAFPPRKLI